MSEQSEKLAANIRKALGTRNDDAEAVTVLVEKLRHQLDQALADVARYRYIRDNQYWMRREATDFDPAFALIGVEFDYSDDFQSKAMLDYHIDKRLREEANND